jgi:hypothetical protein
MRNAAHVTLPISGDGLTLGVAYRKVRPCCLMLTASRRFSRRPATWVAAAKDDFARDLFLLGLGEGPISEDLFTPEDVRRWCGAGQGRTDNT